MAADNKQKYLSYNGAARRPMVFGVPFAAGMVIGVSSMMISLVLGMIFGLAGWLSGLIAIPLLIFIRVICVSDDRAVEIFMLELKWWLIKLISGNQKFHGGMLGISPITFGRRAKNVKRYFETAVFR